MAFICKFVFILSEYYDWITQLIFAVVVGVVIMVQLLIVFIVFHF